MSNCRCNNPSGDWEEGDIAFLRPYDEYTPLETKELIEPTQGHRYGHMPVHATGHPVIILRRLSRHSSHVLVSTVSAYGSGSLTSGNYVAPWNNPRQRKHTANSFRSFEGCEIYRGSDALDRPALRLQHGGQFPKPETSWVNVQNAYVVPISVLSVFTKPRRGRSIVLLQMEQQSLQDLRSDMEQRCTRWAPLQMLLQSHEKKRAASISPAPASLSGTHCKTRSARVMADWRAAVNDTATATITATPNRVHLHNWRSPAPKAVARCRRPIAGHR